MNKIVKRGIAAGGILALVGGAVVFASMPDTVEVCRATTGSISTSVSEMGHVQADDPITVYATVAGRIKNIRAKAGEEVKEGAPLADYDLTAMESNLELAQINTSYYADGYEAASIENNKNKAQAGTAAKEAAALKEQYVAAEEDRDRISISQNKKNNSIEATIKGIEAEISIMETNLDIEADKLSSAATSYGEADSAITKANAEIASINKKIKSSESLIKTYQDHLATLEEGSEEYNTYMDLIAKEYETLTANQGERDSKVSERNAMQGARSTASNKKSEEEDEVDSLKGRIRDSRNALASLPTTGMSTEDYARFAELSRQLDLIEKEWTESLSKKNAAEEKIVSEAQIKQHEDSLERAKAEEARAEETLEKGKRGLKAPAAGTVLKRLVDDGAMVEAGTPVFIVQPSSGYKATVMISRFDIGNVEKGQKATIKVGNESYEGTVSSIAAVAENDASGKPKVKVDVTLDDKDARPVIGLEAEVRIFSEGKEETMTLPDKAIYTDDGGAYVYVLNGGRVEKRSVTVGIKGNGATEIEDGLDTNDSVILTALEDSDVGSRRRAAD